MNFGHSASFLLRYKKKSLDDLTEVRMSCYAFRISQLLPWYVFKFPRHWSRFMLDGRQLVRPE